MFNRGEAPANRPSQQSAKQPVQPEATAQVASRQPTTLNPLSVQPSSSGLNVRPPGLRQSTRESDSASHRASTPIPNRTQESRNFSGTPQRSAALPSNAVSERPRSEIPPMPPTSAAHLRQGFVLSVDQSRGEPAVTAIFGSVQPRVPNVRASAPRDPEPGPLKKAAQFFRSGLGKSISGGLGRLRNRLVRAQPSPATGSNGALAVSAPTLVAAPEARRFTQQDVLLRVDGAIRGAQLAERDLGTLNFDSATLEVSHLATGNGTFRRLATALKAGSQLIENSRDIDVPDALKEPLKAIADFYKRPEVTRHLIAAGDERGWARDGNEKIDVQTLRGLANEGVELLRLLGEARDSLALTGTGERPMS
jgi:hypothetical protein